MRRIVLSLFLFVVACRELPDHPERMVQAKRRSDVPRTCAVHGIQLSEGVAVVSSGFPPPDTAAEVERRRTLYPEANTVVSGDPPNTHRVVFFCAECRRVAKSFERVPSENPEP